MCEEFQNLISFPHSCFWRSASFFSSNLALELLVNGYWSFVGYWGGGFYFPIAWQQLHQLLRPRRRSTEPATSSPSSCSSSCSSSWPGMWIDTAQPRLWPHPLRHLQSPEGYSLKIQWISDRDQARIVTMLLLHRLLQPGKSSKQVPMRFPVGRTLYRIGKWKRSGRLSSGFVAITWRVMEVKERSIYIISCGVNSIDVFC